MKTDNLAYYLEILIDSYAADNSYEKGKTREKQGVVYIPVELEKFTLEFAYNKTSKANYPISTLSCRVYLDKNSRFFFEIPEIIDYINALDYHCYYFPYIENEDRMEACFKYITDFIKFRYDEISELTYLSYKYKKSKLEEIKDVFDIETADYKLFNDESEKKLYEIDSYVSSFIIGRFTKGKAYLAYLENDFEAALKEYKKMDKLTSYEKKLVEFIENSYAPYQAIDIECASVLDVQKYTSKKEFKFFALSLLASAAAFYIVFFIIQLILNLIYKSTTLFTDGMNPFLTSLWGLLPGIFGFIAFRGKIEPLIRKDKKQAYDFYNLLSDSRDNRVKKLIAFVIALCIGIVMFADFCRPSFVLYPDRMKYNSHSRTFNNYAVYTPDEFEDVVLILDRAPKEKKNNDEVEYDHYAIKLKNHQYIDIDDLHLSEKRREKLIKELRGSRTYSIPRYRSIEELN